MIKKCHLRSWILIFDSFHEYYVDFYDKILRISTPLFTWCPPDAHSSALISVVTTKITRQESWDIEYRKWPYLRHATDEQLRVRLFEIINNQRTLTEENKIGLLSPDKIGEFWMSRFSHVLEECGWRGRGIQPISDFASELKGVCDPIPDVEIRLREYTKARSVVNFQCGNSTKTPF